jgi:hypothetical protein
MYYSFVIGTACATDDVNITAKRLSWLTALHCIVAFFFNTTILALMVNIGAGFFEMATRPLRAGRFALSAERILAPGHVRAVGRRIEYRFGLSAGRGVRDV